MKYIKKQKSPCEVGAHQANNRGSIKNLLYSAVENKITEKHSPFLGGVLFFSPLPQISGGRALVR